MSTDHFPFSFRCKSGMLSLKLMELKDPFSVAGEIKIDI